MSGAEPSELDEYDKIVAAFEREQHKHLIDAQNLVNHITSSPELKPHIHSVRFRVKEAGHLRQKLIRKDLERRADGKELITLDNYKTIIPDLAGVRILHLRTQQIRFIHPSLLTLFDSEGYNLAEPTEAKTWDPEYEAVFRDLGITTKLDPRMYTSIHYVVVPSSVSGRRCELQVRTLAEEVWGEVSHTINYPNETTSIACQEQLKVLARVVSGCTRLVDSLFASYAEHDKQVQLISESSRGGQATQK